MLAGLCETRLGAATVNSARRDCWCIVHVLGLKYAWVRVGANVHAFKLSSRRTCEACLQHMYTGWDK